MNAVATSYRAPRRITSKGDSSYLAPLPLLQGGTNSVTPADEAVVVLPRAFPRLHLSIFLESLGYGHWGFSYSPRSCSFSCDAYTFSVGGALSALAVS